MIRAQRTATSLAIGHLKTGSDGKAAPPFFNCGCALVASEGPLTRNVQLRTLGLLYTLTTKRSPHERHHASCIDPRQQPADSGLRRCFT